jgi:hypothetical protein
VRRIADELWDSGKVISDKPVAQVLADLKTGPDFQAGAENLLWIHRRMGDAEVYFVSNQEGTGRVVDCSFRVVDQQPELWDAATGQIRNAPMFTNEAGLTRLPIKFDPSGSVFVVFRRPARGATGGKNWDEFTPTQEISGGWTVRFDPRWGGPGVVTFDGLTDWTKRDEPGIRYYSGTAVYRKEFDWTRRDGRLFLDLGALKNLAEVLLNGKNLGVLWKPPFRVEVTGALQPGKNELEIRVTNLWPNRLIGDEQQPDDCVESRKGLDRHRQDARRKGRAGPSLEGDPVVAGRGQTASVGRPVYLHNLELLQEGFAAVGIGPAGTGGTAGHDAASFHTRQPTCRAPSQDLHPAKGRGSRCRLPVKGFDERSRSG